MMDSECAFCGSAYGHGNGLCYGCRDTLPALARLGVVEADRYLRARYAWNTTNYKPPETRDKMWEELSQAKKALKAYLEEPIKPADHEATVQLFCGDKPIEGPSKIPLIDALMPDLFLAHGGCPIFIELLPSYPLSDMIEVKVSLLDLMGVMHTFHQIVGMPKGPEK